MGLQGAQAGAPSFSIWGFAIIALAGEVLGANTMPLAQET